MATLNDPHGRGPVGAEPQMIETIVRTKGGVVYMSRHDDQTLAERIQSVVDTLADSGGMAITLERDADYVLIPVEQVDHVRVRVVR